MEMFWKDLLRMNGYNAAIELGVGNYDYKGLGKHYENLEATFSSLCWEGYITIQTMNVLLLVKTS